MNKRLFIFIFVFIIIGVLFSLFLFNTTNNENNIIIKKYDKLNIISEHNEYVLVLEKESTELKTYAIYKNSEYNNYRRIFILPQTTETMENKLIYWTNDKLFYFGYTPTSYNLTKSKEIITIDLIKLLNNSPGQINKILGISDNYIYYEYLSNNIYKYGKIDTNFEEIKIIDKQEIPQNLN